MLESAENITNSFQVGKLKRLAGKSIRELMVLRSRNAALEEDVRRLALWRLNKDIEEPHFSPSIKSANITYKIAQAALSVSSTGHGGGGEVAYNTGTPSRESPATGADSVSSASPEKCPKCGGSGRLSKKEYPKYLPLVKAEWTQETGWTGICVGCDGTGRTKEA